MHSPDTDTHRDTPAAAMLNGLTKGMPGNLRDTAPRHIGQRGWNILREDLPLPAAVIRQSALEHNGRWMRQFVQAHGGLLAPHGKTTMSPELFARQLADGAWGMTLATAHQVQVARHFGVQRIFLANQLVGKQAIDYVLGQLRDDEHFDFYCVVDSPRHVQTLADAARSAGIAHPLQVLVEIGVPGARAGCRSTADALEVARAVRAQSPWLSLRGIEGFEGILSHPDPRELARQVEAFLARMLDVAGQCDREDLYGVGTVLLSAGGSAFYDLVLKTLGDARLSRPSAVLTRSGCYLTHDSKKYRDAQAHLVARNGGAGADEDGLRPALEVWAYVHSRPEPGRVIVGMGKRDISYDDLPAAQRWYRPGPDAAWPQPLPDTAQVVRLDDQHCHMRVAPDSPLRTGDMVQFGISHPCLTFDKWRAICLVDDDYTVVGAVSTYF